MQREANKIVYSLLGNNMIFYWKVVLSRIKMSDDRMKEYMDKINGK